jgi:hypothetical protein
VPQYSQNNSVHSVNMPQLIILQLLLPLLLLGVLAAVAAGAETQQA